LRLRDLWPGASATADAGNPEVEDEKKTGDADDDNCGAGAGAWDDEDMAPAVRAAVGTRSTFDDAIIVGVPIIVGLAIDNED
jgi:hypothetical protein